jgi:cytoskeleton-associated protein 5
LVSNRTSTKQKAGELILLFVEIDSAPPVVDELLKFISHKSPKLIAASILQIADIVW